MKVYLSGEIHTDWREQIIEGCKAKGLNISFTSANTDHESSDAAGDGLGAESQQFLARPQVCKSKRNSNSNGYQSLRCRNYSFWR